MSADQVHFARELLAFYQAAGVDALVNEAPVNRLVAEPPPAPALPPTPQGAKAPAPPPAPRAVNFARPSDPAVPGPLAPPPDAAVAQARAAAKEAANLEELRAILDRFEGCGLR